MEEEVKTTEENIPSREHAVQLSRLTSTKPPIRI
jgi:hypothetical protein